ncbi:MAG TPA: hypothetical protein VEI07_17165 [Planctomycetaceae bacterium]|nr:hypothetical protein [Planctomycetaceae bacterium]
MLKLASRSLTGRRKAWTALRLLVLPIVWGLQTARVAQADWSATILPLLAQAKKTATTSAPDVAAESGGSWPVLDWAIVVVLIGVALYAICRSSRRN